ncbi:flagellar hook-length control protein FliK [Paracoccus methylarcula]|uniref:Flagellar hook-length control protein FliK n=1 Tax=Paracoccus methylarcula TaxID=72022 RepID=A0A422QWV9_9RHOB|nr:flagellar hook-length control protein FliK [Paracoccus methylarcula]RNF34444.1 flagellar hook-length control protein FliK [Paracoccus methylarcula]
MDPIIPQSFAPDTGQGMRVPQCDHCAEAEPLAENLVSIEFFQALEIKAAHMPVSEADGLQPAPPEDGANHEFDSDPVTDILEGWSGVTASLPASSAGDDAGDDIPPDRRVITPHVPAGFSPAQPAAESGKHLALADGTGQPHEAGENGVEPPHGSASRPIAGPESAFRAPSISSGVSHPASGMPDDASARITEPKPDQIAPRTYPAMSGSVRTKKDESIPHPAISEAPAKNTAVQPIDSTAGLLGQKPIPPVTGSTDLSLPPPTSSDQLSTSATTQPTGARSPLVHTASVLRQVSDAVVTMRDEMVEITLSPEELGRVRMVLTGHDRAPHLTIWAERPDVLDQMRRNSDMLLQQFNDEGLTDATLDFRGGRREGAGTEAGQEWPTNSGGSGQRGGLVQTDPDRPAPVLPMRTGSRRIDIRM